MADCMFRVHRSEHKKKQCCLAHFHWSLTKLFGKKILPWCLFHISFSFTCLVWLKLWLHHLYISSDLRSQSQCSLWLCKGASVAVQLWINLVSGHLTLWSQSVISLRLNCTFSKTVVFKMGWNDNYQSF